MKALCAVLLCLEAACFAQESQMASGAMLDIPQRLDHLETSRSSEISLIGRFHRFLASHQLEVKFDEVLPATSDIERSLKKALDYLNGLDTDEDESGRKGGGGLGGKKGGGAILAMATMMGGTMAALGFGAVGMLAMKALTVSAMALMLSAVIGLKKLLSKDEGDGGHSVSYIPVHGGGGHGGHRRRRDLELPYAAYNPDVGGEAPGITYGADIANNENIHHSRQRSRSFNLLSAVNTPVRRDSRDYRRSEGRPYAEYASGVAQIGFHKPGYSYDFPYSTYPKQ